MATGNQTLISADPSDDSHDKLDDLSANSKSTALARYVELMDAMQEAAGQSTDAKALLGVRNVDLMPGLDNDLADVCVASQMTASSERTTAAT